MLVAAWTVKATPTTLIGPAVGAETIVLSPEDAKLMTATFTLGAPMITYQAAMAARFHEFVDTHTYTNPESHVTVPVTQESVADAGVRVARSIGPSNSFIPELVAMFPDDTMFLADEAVPKSSIWIAFWRNAKVGTGVRMCIPTQPKLGALLKLFPLRVSPTAFPPFPDADELFVNSELMTCIASVAPVHTPPGAVRK
jgi:hypothetical protein